MSEKTLSNEILEIAHRIKELREVCEVSSEELAEKLNLNIEQYSRYEEGKDDIPIGVIYAVARVLKVDSTTLLTGDSARMIDYTVVRKGKGISIERFPGYSFSSLAINYIGRQMDPMIVSLCEEDEAAPLVKHSGQEFNYVIEGTVAVTVGTKQFVLEAGDSIYFNPSLPHGQRAKNGNAKFLTVINE